MFTKYCNCYALSMYTLFLYSLSVLRQCVGCLARPCLITKPTLYENKWSLFCHQVDHFIHIYF